jgi:hypothetical protein
MLYYIGDPLPWLLGSAEQMALGRFYVPGNSQPYWDGVEGECSKGEMAREDVFEGWGPSLASRSSWPMRGRGNERWHGRKHAASQKTGGDTGMAAHERAAGRDRRNLLIARGLSSRHLALAGHVAAAALDWHVDWATRTLQPMIFACIQHSDGRKFESRGVNR